MNPLVAYFSATGVTAGAAKALAQAVNGALYEIRPAVPYTSADLNWRDAGSRSSVEMKDPGSRPALADTNAPVDGHDVVFWDFPFGGMLPPPFSTLFWRHTTFPAKPLFFLQLPAEAVWASRQRGCVPAPPVQKS